MMKKWLMLTLLTGGATLFTGCLGAFWNGFWNTGWPKNRWIDIGLSVANELITR